MEPKAYEYIPLRFAAYTPYSRKMVIAYTTRDAPEAPPAQPELTTADHGIVLSSNTDAEVLGESHPFLFLCISFSLSLSYSCAIRAVTGV